MVDRMPARVKRDTRRPGTIPAKAFGLTCAPPRCYLTER
jgi:hypothetical protein